MESQKSILKLEQTEISIKRKKLLHNLDMEIFSGDFIGIYGLNGSGKSLLSELLGGGIKPSSGKLICSDDFSASIVSSSEQKKMLEQERCNDDSEFMEGKTDPGRSVFDIISQSADPSLKHKYIEDYAQLFGISHILERGIKFISTGEFRKMMIVRAVLARPDIIVLDDPYTGLDIGTRKMLEGLIPEIRKNTNALLIISGRLDDLGSAERLFFLNDMKILEVQNISKIKNILKNDMSFKLEMADAETKITPDDKTDDTPHEKKKSIELIRLAGVKMSYYEHRILNDINWLVNEGEHWQITGPNGSGKSSLLSLINGDSPKAYGQEIYLFGRKRGTGETIWDIKQNIGFVSGALQYQHRINQNVLSVVVSGFFDSIGLYDKPDPLQIETAKKWCEEFGISELYEKPFNCLSEGMKRSVLIIRAIVKEPILLILDEPCQGLDDYNSKFVLDVARMIILRNHSTLLYVSHDPFYNMKEIPNKLTLVPHEDGGFTGRLLTDRPL